MKTIIAELWTQNCDGYFHHVGYLELQEEHIERKISHDLASNKMIEKIKFSEVGIQYYNDHYAKRFDCNIQHYIYRLNILNKPAIRKAKKNIELKIMNLTKEYKSLQRALVNLRDNEQQKS